MKRGKNIKRRNFLKLNTAGFAGLAATPVLLNNEARSYLPSFMKPDKIIYRALGKTGLKLPVVSMGVTRADMFKIYIPVLMIMLFSCNRHISPPETVNQVNIEKYAGKWYEIATIPARFQKNCKCTSAEYTLTGKDYIKVYNRCVSTKDGKVKDITGKAFPVKNSNNSKLKVQFFWPFRGNYWIVDLASDYSWAVVSDPSRKYLWILSRNKQMENEKYKKITSTLQERGFDLTNLKKTKQDCPVLSQ